jgi:tetratricopeptide (TPR) repeat protein
MKAFEYRSELARRIGWVLFVFICVCIGTANAQLSCGDRPCPRVVIAPSKPSPPVKRRPRPRPRVNPATPQPEPQPEPEPEPVCEDSDLIVVCGMPGCEITLNGKNKHVTNELGGFSFQVPGNQNYTVRITKTGYDPYEIRKNLGCHDYGEVPARLTGKPVTLRIRTIPAECDIYLDGQKQAKGTDAQGLFSFLLAKPNVLIEARKQKYLSKTKSVVLAPELANGEIVLQLEPLPSKLNLTSNVGDAQVKLDNQTDSKPIAERLLLTPGPHTLTVQALGYAPVKLEVTVSPDDSINREVKLERLPSESLLQQAAAALNDRRYNDALKLCQYIFENDPANPGGHRLAGQVYVERGDFGNAGSHFAKALAGGESVTLRIRRHAAEKFDLNKGHDLCEARLVLSKSDFEFQGTQVATENFKVPYDQIQIIGLQLKNSRASYLSTKVTVATKRRDFNFYSYDNEMSQTGKPYLEMIQGLLHAH